MNIILCGMPMSGKTTLGKKVATKLNWTFVDTDCLIEEKFCKTCRDIYLKQGEQTFREYEKQMIATLLDRRDCVIATGGGTMQDKENRQLLKRVGFVVYLKAGNELLFSRFKNFPATLDPQNPRQSWESLVAERSPIFEEMSDLTLDTENFPQDELIERISRCAVPLS